MLSLKKYKKIAYLYAQKILLFLKNTSPRTRAIALFVFFISLVLYVLFLQAPKDYPENYILNIPEGTTISEIGLKLSEEEIIKSDLLFKIFASLFGEILSGDYYFNKRHNVISVAYRLSRGEFGIKAITITIPEGFTSYQIGELLGKKLPDFDVEKFNKLAIKKEGRLFPDTYKFLPNAQPEEIIKTTSNTFEERVSEIEKEINDFNKPFSEILIMASLLEREARQYETKRIVAGVLWKRIEIGMALQVDAVFGYINRTETFNPTIKDLEIDSPYNTYTNVGLPPGSISNPGIDSIRAAVNPTETNYLYYLTGKDGMMYYSETFERHLKNKRLYLN